MSGGGIFTGSILSTSLLSAADPLLLITSRSILQPCARACQDEIGSSSAAAIYHLTPTPHSQPY
jgi:hypothetical protein